jgi:hypothetical protein
VSESVGSLATLEVEFPLALVARLGPVGSRRIVKVVSPLELWANHFLLLIHEVFNLVLPCQVIIIVKQREGVILY